MDGASETWAPSKSNFEGGSGNQRDRVSSSPGGGIKSRGTAPIHLSMAGAMMDPAADDVAAYMSCSPRVGPFPGEGLPATDGVDCAGQQKVHGQLVIHGGDVAGRCANIFACGLQAYRQRPAKFLRHSSYSPSVSSAPASPCTRLEIDTLHNILSLFRKVSPWLGAFVVVKHI